MAEGRGATADDSWAIGDALARAWEDNADFVARTNAPMQRWMVERLEPQPGQTILELGAGPGDTGFEVAQTLGADGKLISTDISPEMVEVAKRRVSTFGVTNVEFRVMDAQEIELPDSAVDGVIHRFGPMLLPDPDASFAEVHRVLRDGGLYLSTVIGGPQDNPWMTSIGMSVMQAGIQMPGGGPMGPGGPFSLADPDQLRERIARAGFDEVTVEPLDLSFDFATAEEAWGTLSSMAGPIAILISGLDQEKRQSAKDAFVGMVDQYRSGDGCSIPGRALCAQAR
jgi:SAM-dependent methyltransferase